MSLRAGFPQLTTSELPIVPGGRPYDRHSQKTPTPIRAAGLCSHGRERTDEARRGDRRAREVGCGARPARYVAGYEAGPEGLEILVIGAPNLGKTPRDEVEGRRDWWADSRPAARCGTEQRRPVLPAGPVAVAASRPATGPALAILQLLLGPANAAFSGHVPLGVLHPADELVARQGRDVLPGLECRGVGDQRLAQIRGQLVHHPTGDSPGAHRATVAGRTTHRPRNIRKAHDLLDGVFVSSILGITTLRTPPASHRRRGRARNTAMSSLRTLPLARAGWA